ncbi:16 kDa phloem protein 1-like [Coffea arabica]|uniref:16 kDa phloem protein 1-like n=1 Tax=Coffea arabica TaxID=13443 RepID=A0ABM4WNB5_COFAR
MHATETDVQPPLHKKQGRQNNSFFSSVMGGTLEVLLVCAEGIRHTNIVGKPTYYVILECRDQVHQSKTSRGHEEVFWNEKFTFELPERGTDDEIYLKLKIMDEEFFSRGAFVGQTTIFLKGIIVEGKDKGIIEVKPAPYNVVLDDDTFKGQISIGLKYSANAANLKIQQIERRQGEADENGGKGSVGHSICSSIATFWRNPWWRFLFRSKKSKSREKQKRN